jgi:ornithine cyclodeaminase/alanine dehydrogenase-like protein (mu-crystallin family)
VSVLVLSETDVRRVLDMESCIEAMEDALAALARDELTMPLRFVFRPPGEALLGLMPAHRGDEAPLFALKEIVVAPANGARGLDPHQGAVLLHDGVTGVLTAILNASPITEIRTAAVSAVATQLLARRGARRVAILGSGVQARSHAHAMRVVLEDPELRVWSRTPAHAEALALESHAVVCDTIEEALDGADVVCTCTAAREPIYVDRRESTLIESGDYQRAVEEAGIGPDHILAELGELLIGAHPGRRDDDEVTVFKSLGLAVEDLAAAALAVERARERGLGVEVPF